MLNYHHTSTNQAGCQLLRSYNNHCHKELLLLIYSIIEDNYAVLFIN